jgi:hypothetical protein
MSRSNEWTVTCDIVSPNCIHTGSMPSQSLLPSEWMNITGALFGATGQAGNNVDVCPACMGDLSVLPPAWAAIIPTVPS